MPRRGRNRPQAQIKVVYEVERTFAKSPFLKRVLENKGYLSCTSRSKDYKLHARRLIQFGNQLERHLKGCNFDESYWDDFAELTRTFTAVQLLFIVHRESNYCWTTTPDYQDPYTPERIARRKRYNWRRR